MENCFYDITTMSKNKKPSNEIDSISRRILALMEPLDMLPLHLSQKTGIANAIIYKCLGGTRKWNLGHLEKIAPVLGVPIADLIQENLMVSQVGGIRDGQGPPQSQVLHPPPGQISRPLRFKVDTTTLTKMYCLEVEDRSLMPVFPAGTFFTAQKDTAELITDGNFVVYWDEDGQTYIRQIFLNQDHIVLRSLTQGVPDKLLPKKHMALCDKILRVEFPNPVF